MRDEAEAALLLDRLDCGFDMREELDRALHEEAEEVALARRHLAAPDHLDIAAGLVNQLLDALAALHMVVIGDGDDLQATLLRHLQQALRAGRAVAEVGVQVQIGPRHPRRVSRMLLWVPILRHNQRFILHGHRSFRASSRYRFYLVALLASVTVGMLAAG